MTWQVCSDGESWLELLYWEGGSSLASTHVLWLIGLFSVGGMVVRGGRPRWFGLSFFFTTTRIASVGFFGFCCGFEGRCREFARQRNPFLLARKKESKPRFEYPRRNSRRAFGALFKQPPWVSSGEVCSALRVARAFRFGGRAFVLVCPLLGWVQKSLGYAVVVLLGWEMQPKLYALGYLLTHAMCVEFVFDHSIFIQHDSVEYRVLHASNYCFNPSNSKIS